MVEESRVDDPGAPGHVTRMADPASFPEYAQINRAHWNRHADWWASAGRREWAGQVDWGIWGIPNAELPLLPDDMTGLDAIELGCGTAYVSGWMARRGARVTGIDPSDRQLETARTLAAEHGIGIELIHGVAESVPLPDATFDFAISEYGAAIWADPQAWIPETWRLLRPGGRLHFIGHHPLTLVCSPVTEEDVPVERTLHRPWFGLHQLAWPSTEDPSVEFNLPTGDWFALFRQTGFLVEDYREIRAPDDLTEEKFGIPADWAKQYPSEQAWFLRKAE